MTAFEFNYKVTGNDRKRLVSAIGEILEVPPKYLGAPTFAYEVDYITIDKNGIVSFDDRADSDEIEMLVETLLEKGFEPEARFEDLQMTEEEELGLGRQRRDPIGEDGMQPSDVPDEAESEDSGDSLILSYPRKDISDTALENLRLLVASKELLIKKVLGANALPIEVTDEAVSFPWFAGFPQPEEISAYAHFTGKLIGMAKTQKRVTAKEKETDNEKYAFR
ncbi:MAG: virulence protein, partial [Clostridia bacterium]|nr:virulence protein [Clostridia bacterium]